MTPANVGLTLIVYPSGTELHRNRAVYDETEALLRMRVLASWSTVPKHEADLTATPGV